jgi:hypothetical protein
MDGANLTKILRECCSDVTQAMFDANSGHIELSKIGY